jgi:hypothetical protein
MLPTAPISQRQIGVFPKRQVAGWRVLPGGYDLQFIAPDASASLVENEKPEITHIQVWRITPLAATCETDYDEMPDEDIIVFVDKLKKPEVEKKI